MFGYSTITLPFFATCSKLARGGVLYHRNIIILVIVYHKFRHTEVEKNFVDRSRFARDVGQVAAPRDIFAG